MLGLLWRLAPLFEIHLPPMDYLRRFFFIYYLQGQTRHLLLPLHLCCPVCTLGGHLRMVSSTSTNFILAELGDHFLLSFVEILQVSSENRGALFRTGLLAAAIVFGVMWMTPYSWFEWRNA